MQAFKRRIKGAREHYMRERAFCWAWSACFEKSGGGINGGRLGFWIPVSENSLDKATSD